MRKLFFLFLLSISFISASAQKNAKGADAKAPALAAAHTDTTLIIAYNQAMNYADYEAAKNVIFTLMSKDVNNTAWLDSLVRLYFTMGAYSQCVLAGSDYLAKSPSNAVILELVAASDYSLKRYKEALDDYEKLFKISGSPYHAYQIAINQYMLKRYGECQETIQFILVDKTSEQQKVVINLSNGGSQQVPLKAAAWNLRGVVLKDLSKNDEAKTCFEESLKVYPDFALAKGNLDAMKPAEKSTEKPAGPAVKKTK